MGVAATLPELSEWTLNHTDLNTQKQDRNCKFGPQRHKTWKEKEYLQYIFRGSDKTILYST